MLTELGALGLVLYILSAIAVILLATLTHRTSRTRFEKLPLKKIAWGILVVGAAYWYVTAPYSTKQRNSPASKLILQADLESDSPETRYIHDHHYRIEDLERELEDTKKNLAKLTNHYYLALRLAMLGIIFFGTSFIVNSRRPESNDQVRLDLDTE